jgi:hypothetical protein
MKQSNICAVPSVAPSVLRVKRLLIGAYAAMSLYPRTFIGG